MKKTILAVTILLCASGAFARNVLSDRQFSACYLESVNLENLENIILAEFDRIDYNLEYLELYREKLLKERKELYGRRHTVDEAFKLQEKETSFNRMLDSVYSSREVALKHEEILVARMTLFNDRCTGTAAPKDVIEKYCPVGNTAKWCDSWYK